MTKTIFRASNSKKRDIVYIPAFLRITALCLPLALFWATFAKRPNNRVLRDDAGLKKYYPVEIVPTAIFFHVYVPHGGDPASLKSNSAKMRALKIIREQIRQVGHALSAISSINRVPLFYTTVGQPLRSGYIEEICSEFSIHLVCNFLRHVDSGFEEHTLTALHDYCLMNGDHRVVYMHTKGSYHARKEQDNWRQHLTHAVTSRECIERGHTENCQLCGLQFMPRPSLHFTGNFFNAKCSYIRKLPNPIDFQKKMSWVVGLGQQMLSNGTLTSTMMDVGASCNNGLNRFAMEHWHGSHPSLEKICDLSTHYQSEFWENVSLQDLGEDEYQFDFFPRHPATAAWSNGFSDMLINFVLKDESLRKREYFLLPGQLFRWYQLYNEFPPSSSWVWSWYPDGQFWKKQVEKYGGDALMIVASQWIYD